jgi:hypothetical protein
MPSPKRKPHPLENLTFDAAPAPAPQPQPAPAPPAVVPEDPIRSSNVTLPASIWEWIDRKQVEARSRGGAPFRKSAIIRAAFLVAMSAEADISGALSEEEIAELMIRAVVEEHK